MERSRRLLYLYAAGLAGCGKSTIIRHIITLLNSRPELGIAPMNSLDGDFFHSEEAIGRMTAGRGLTHDERRIWVPKVLSGVYTLAHCDISGMVACSLLLPEYRRAVLDAFPHTDRSFFPYRELRAQSSVVWLDVDPDELLSRVRRRHEAGQHWFPPSLVQHQIASATQVRNSRTYIGPVPGEEQNVLVYKPTANAETDARSILEQLIPGF